MERMQWMVVETPYGDPSKEAGLFCPGTAPASACFWDAQEQAQKLPAQDDFLPSKSASVQPGEPNNPGLLLHKLQATQIIIKKNIKDNEI